MREFKNKKNELRKILHDAFSEGLECCLYPGAACRNKPSKAHTISKSKVLEQLDINSHVIAFKKELDLDSGSFKFDKVGIKQHATTFTGLCNEHDSSMFELIDNHDIDPSNKEQLFLLAYRAVLSQMYDKLAAMTGWMSVYEKMTATNCLKSKEDEYLKIEIQRTTFECMKSYNYMSAYNAAFNNDDFDEISHYYRVISDVKPTLAVSSIINFAENSSTPQNIHDPQIYALNVFPQKSNLVIVISFKRAHKSAVWPYISELDNADDKYLLYRLSKLILIHCENFVLSPKHFETFSEGKKQAIKKYFRETIDWKDWDDPDLFLF